MSADSSNTVHRVTVTKQSPDKTVAQGYHGEDLELFLREQVTFLEQRDHLTGYAITDTSVPNPHLGGRSFTPRTTKLAPKHIQELTLEESLFSRFGFSVTSSRPAIRILGGLGIFTCADALATGSTYIQEQTAGLKSRNVFGPDRILNLTKLVKEATGLALPQHRADPSEQHLYYSDIRKAGLGLALPGVRFQTYQDFQFKLGHHRQTVGSLVGASLADLRECAPNINEARMADFAVNEVMENVIKPFNRAGQPQ